MDFRIMLASFALVFLAELGDKTQLTALAFSTSSRSPWAVFIGTSLALIAASGLAVLFGELLGRFLPVKTLHIISAVLFIVMGMILLVNIARKAEYEESRPTEGGQAEVVAGNLPDGETSGFLFRMIVGQAVAFEESLVDYLDSLAQIMPEGRERKSLKLIVAADREHARQMRQMNRQQVQDATKSAAAAAADLHELQSRIRQPDIPRFAACRPTADREKGLRQAEIRPILETAIEAEENIAEFYLALARISKLHSVRDAFRQLAMEDIEHAQELCSLINPEG